MNFVSHILTIGHSNHSWETFRRLLSGGDVTAIADVRTTPHSRHTPHFNRDVLGRELKAVDVAYVFLGDRLGGRPSRPDLFCDGVADYRRMAREPLFVEGLERVLKGAKSHRVALMCSEKEPLDCHRCLLVGRELAARGAKLSHILADGRIEEQWETEERLLAAEGMSHIDMFTTRAEQVAMAYDRRSAKAAYADATAETGSTAAA
jgi:uncharacterized protein (DUF488 family)